MLNIKQALFSRSLISQDATFPSNPLMDVSEIRKENLRLLLKDKANGKMVDLATALETAPAYLSQILSAKGKRDLGPKLARRAESVYSLGRGWMDRRHGTAADSEAVRYENTNKNAPGQIDVKHLADCIQVVEEMLPHSSYPIPAQTRARIISAFYTRTPLEGKLPEADVVKLLRPIKRRIEGGHGRRRKGSVAESDPGRDSGSRKRTQKPQAPRHTKGDAQSRDDHPE